MSLKINEVARCKDKICNTKKFEVIHENKIKGLKKVCEKFEKKIKEKNRTLESIKLLKTVVHDLKKKIKELDKDSYKKKEIEKMKKVCETTYCNKGCKGTLFQKGVANKLPNNVVDGVKKNKVIPGKYKKTVLGLLLTTRKKMFKGKTDVLKNNFYEGLKNSNVKKMKKNGAVSGCAIPFE